MAEMITSGFVVLKCRMNPHRRDDRVIYKKFLGFLPNEESVKEYEKKHSRREHSEIVKIGEYSPGIDLD